MFDGNEGKTPLMLCIDNEFSSESENPLECLSILIKNGANTECQNKNGINVFHVAIKERRIDIIIYLLQNTSIDVFYQKSPYIESPDELCKLYFSKLEYS